MFIIRVISSLSIGIVEGLGDNFLMATIVLNWNLGAFKVSTGSSAFRNNNNAHYWSSVGDRVLLWCMYFESLASNLFA